MPEPIYKALAPMLNGNYPVESIFCNLADVHAASDVLAALDRLRKHGYLADDAADLKETTRAFWEHAGVPPSLAVNRLQQSSVSIRILGESVNQTHVARLKECLTGNGVKVQHDAAYTIVITDDYLHPDLQDWNRLCLAREHPWLLVKPWGLQTWMGPAIVPGQSACWQCLAQRLRWHRRVECFLGARSAAKSCPVAPLAALESSVSAQLAEVAAELARWIATGQSALHNQVISTHLLTLERQHHYLVHRPQCPACGNAAAGDIQHLSKPALRSRIKVSSADGGGHRVMSAREVEEKLSRHISPITGIVGELEMGCRAGPMSSGARWMTPTYSAEHNFNDMHDERFMLHEGLRRRSGGKGKSEAQARASAVGESLERYSGVFDGTEPRLQATFDSLGAEAIHPNACMAYSEQQYRNRATSNARQHKAHWVPQPFDASARMDWSPLWSLSSGRRYYLPTSYCYFGYRSCDPVFARADSNGCAAGAVLEEAILQGVLELIERDAVAIWWYNRIERSCVDLDDVADSYGRDLVMHYQSLARELWVLDITSDVNIPVFAALSRRTDKPEEDIIYGFGCHLDPDVALVRALTEVNQSLEAVPAASGDASSQTHLGSDEAIHWWRTVRVNEHPYLKPRSSSMVRSADATEWVNPASEDIARDVQTCVDVLASRGMDTLVLDQTRPDIDLPVVRVVVPGLRHFWARFGEGRLYDVPVQQGWQRAALTESQLNPFVIQF